VIANGQLDVSMQNTAKNEAPLIVTPDRACIHDLGLGEARILVDEKLSGGAFWLGIFRQDPGFLTPLHLHRNTDEYLFVIAGVLSVYLSDGWHDLEAGTLAIVPRTAQHAQHNAGKQPAWVIGSGNPTGFEGFFAAQQELLSRIQRSDPQFFPGLAKILTEYDTEFLGPPPARD
jgi:mannose-6-phosphate isomerase-like protein (cupin superfamily)